jgi:hypothetical protein
MSALNSETQHEWQTGLDQLLPSYQYLFDGTIIKPLSDSINQKLMWLLSIWAARDNEIHIGTMRQRNSTILTIYDCWKRKNNNE